MQTPAERREAREEHLKLIKSLPDSGLRVSLVDPDTNISEYLKKLADKTPTSSYRVHKSEYR